MLLRNMRSIMTAICLTVFCMSSFSLVALPGANTINNDKIAVDQNILQQLHGDAFCSKQDFILSESKIQLNDSTWWRVKPEQAGVIVNWLNEDILFIKPRVSSCFSWKSTSQYPFVLKNHNTQQTVEIVLAYVPNENEMTLYNHYIIDINKKSNVVQLNDGSFWKVNARNIPKDWDKGQVIIVGLSKKWRQDAAPYVLINAGIVNSYQEASLVKK